MARWCHLTEARRLEPAFCSGDSKTPSSCKNGDLSGTVPEPMIFSFVSALWIWIALLRQAASVILAQTPVATLEELVFLTVIYMVPELILQSSFKASSGKLAILAHDSSLPSGDVYIKWIVFMCPFPSFDCRGGLECLTEMEMLRILKAKMIMCMSYKPETSQKGVAGRFLSGRGISPSAEFCV